MKARWVTVLAVALAMIAGVTLLAWYINDDQTKLKLSGASYHVSIMRSDQERQKGLSGTDSLSEGEAMVFVFPSDGKWGIWMKDMSYPIDIVWLNKQGEVVHMVKNAQPSSYPDTIFTPSVDSRYVIELPNGTIERTGIVEGALAELPAGLWQ